jgi:SAM-dependent methyltransferase
MEDLSPSIVLAAYAEQLFDGRRVVVFGDSTSAVAEELVERGARTVHVFDPEASRAAVSSGQNRTKQITVAPLDDADLAVRDGAFDVAFIEDLSSFAEPEALLRRARRALSSRGTAVVAAPNPEARIALVQRTSASRSSTALGYYELYDAVSAEFDDVRMLGQTPFVGYAVVDFAPDGEPDVSIDSGLVPGGAEEPEWFVALASRDRVDCDPVGIVQLPAARVVGAKASGGLADDLRAARSSEARLLDRVAQLEVEVSRKQNDADTGAAEHRAKLEAQLLQRDASIADLEAQLAASVSREARTREEIGEHSASLTSELTAQRREVTELAEQNRELSDRVTRLETDKQAAQARIEHQAAELAAERQKLADAEAAVARLKADDETPKELAALEGALRERGEHVRSLQDQLREAERVGRELLRELGRGPGAGASATEQLAAENARLTANLEALSWSVQELEGRLSAAGAAPR